MDLITTAQAAQRREVTQQTIRNWVAAGRLTPVLRLPGKTGALLFNVADVDALASPDSETAA